MNRTHYNWKCRERTLPLGQRTLVMGILNVTPDSFSDGGNFIAANAAVERALEMIKQGADIIDIGGESSRPGAEPVSIHEEMRRTIPVIKQIRTHTNIPLSIDTMKAPVADAAIAAGADIINDVSAFEADPNMITVAASTGAGVVLMHMKGTPRSMQKNPVYENVVDEVCDYLKTRVVFAEQQGVDQNRIVLDPGIGFGKTTAHNLELLQNFPALAACNLPLLIGVSRKRFIGEITGRSRPVERRAGSLGCAAWAIANGAHILRVHDVLDTCDVRRMLDTFCIGDM